MGLKQYECFSISDIAKREINQDYAISLEGKSNLFLLVADGCGAYEGSEEAAKIFCDKFGETLKANEQLLEKNIRYNIYEMARFAKISFIEHLENLGYFEASTTLCVAIINQQRTIFIHAGDSRIYKFSSKGRVWHTRDHSVVEELIGKKQLKRKDAKNHPDANIVTNTIDCYSKIKLEIKIGKPLSKGECLLLCTDGFWEDLDNNMLREIAKVEFSQVKKIINEYSKATILQNPLADNLTAIIYRQKSDND